MRIPALAADPRQRVARVFDAASVFATAAFSVYVVIALAGAGGRALAVTFPIGCLLVGVLTYVRSPGTYIAFTWWTWLLTPCLRRIFDLHYGFQATSPLLLGPLLASAVATLTIFRRRRLLRSSASIPFLVAAAALMYAFAVGVVRQSATAAAYDLLTWIVPIVFGLHLALTWDTFPVTRAAFAPSVLFGLLVTSAYGIWQFADPPVWDRFWVVSAEMYSIGSPLPFVIRVFSTLNAPGPFTIMLIFALLLGLATPHRWRALPLALGLVALVLTKGRSAWGAFVVGALVLQIRQPLRSLPRQWVALLAVLLLAAPILTQPRVLAVLSRRAATLRDVEADHSFQIRASMTRVALSKMASNPAGTGLGALGGATKLLTGGKTGAAFDSAPLEIFAAMGWIGGALFTIALGAIILPIFRARRHRYDPMTGAAVGTVVALLVTCLFGNIFTGVSGWFFWSAVGFATAGRSYATAADVAERLARMGRVPQRTTLARPSAA
jgi:hypothetical protein